MLLSGQHWTRYDYSVPVAPGEHVLRLVPQAPYLDLRVHEVNIEPHPVRRIERVDAQGNRVLHVHFQGSTSSLSVSSRFELETTPPPRLEDDTETTLPWAASTPPPAVAPSVREFAATLAAEVDHRPAAFLRTLTRRLYDRTDRQVRLNGYAQSPEQTLSSAHGACRDLTELFLACARSQGMVGRFVSGYQASAQTSDGQFYLHAWPEVWFPASGWRGFDPTHGVEVSEGHVPLCSAPSQAGTMPIEGGFSFQGPHVDSTLSFGLQIQGH